VSNILPLTDELYPGQSLTRPLHEVLLSLYKNFWWQCENGGFRFENWDQGPPSLYHDAATAGVPFTHKEADLIAKQFGFTKLDRPWCRQVFALRLALLHWGDDNAR
jgi:hypothetical protein